MCGRFNVHDLSSALLWLFGMSEGPDQPARYNITPSQPIAALRSVTEDGGREDWAREDGAGEDGGREDRATDGGAREVVMLRWGLIPSWAKDAAIGARMINARAETVAEKPSFRAAFRQRRCLIPAQGYYEWRKEDGGKQPYHIHMRDGEPFAFAGLWERWHGREGLGGEGQGGEGQSGEGQVIESCTIITTEANGPTRAVHHRMPVIVERKDFDTWLDPGAKGGDTQKALLRPYAGEERMVVHKVSREVNSPQNNHPGCIEPMD